MAISYLSITTNGSVGTYTITKPTVATGDVLVAGFVAASGSPAAPSGWTSLGTFNFSTTINGVMCYRVIDGTEGSSFSFAGTGTPVWGHMLRYSGVDTSSVVDGTATFVSTNISNTMSPASITTTVDGSQLVIFSFSYPTSSDGTGMSPGSGITERGESNFFNTFLFASGDENIASSGATGSRSYSVAGPSEGTAITIGGMVALKNASSPDATATLTTGGETWGGQSVTVSGQKNVVAALTTGGEAWGGEAILVVGSQNATATLTTGGEVWGGETITASGQRNATAALTTGGESWGGESIVVTAGADAIAVLSPGSVVVGGEVIGVTGQANVVAVLSPGSAVVGGGVISVIIARTFDGAGSSAFASASISGNTSSASTLTGSSSIDGDDYRSTTVQSEELHAESILE